MALEKTVNTLKDIGGGIAFFSLIFVTLPFVMYENRKLEKKFREKYGRTLSDEEYHYAVIREMMERELEKGELIKEPRIPYQIPNFV